MDYKQVFSMLIAFIVLVFVLMTVTNMFQSMIDETETTGETVFRTEQYMAGTIHVYSKGDEFGVKRQEDLCNLDSEVLRAHHLGFDIRTGAATVTGEDQCHDPSNYMSSVILEQPGLNPETLEVGER
jgi:hypothetical protein